ncbi:unnamed protein product [Cuscuta campestris]|uniref:Retrotransposon gag domain-containing protein n=1 Tax=Cuscuta campestris TaxID=132261 RepID=A0A484LBG1_9ASTE|nr:unnamed protein product [Cuscuta campestris]
MDANQYITDVTPTSKSWGCKVIVTEKLNERQSARGVTYRAMILEDSQGHKVKVMTYGQDIIILDKRLEVNNTYKIFNAKVSEATQGFGVPDESYRHIWTLNRRTMIHDVSSKEKILIQPSAEPEIDPFSLFYKAMLTNKKINVLAVVIAKLQRNFDYTKKGQKTASDFIIIDHESPRARNSADTAIRHLSHNNCKEDSINIFQSHITYNLTSSLDEWKSSNTSVIEHAIETKKWLDPLSLFAKPEDIQTTPISEVARTTNEGDIHWVEGQLQVLETGDITFYIGCSSCNRKLDYIEGINFKCMLCGDPEAKTIKRFRILSEIKDEISALQVTLFTDTLEKIVRALELNTPMELLKCGDLNNSLASQKANPEIAKFRAKGIDPELEDKLGFLFDGTVAKGDDMWSPSASCPPRRFFEASSSSQILCEDIDIHTTPLEEFGVDLGIPDLNDDHENEGTKESYTSVEIIENPIKKRQISSSSTQKKKLCKKKFGGASMLSTKIDEIKGEFDKHRETIMSRVNKLPPTISEAVEVLMAMKDDIPPCSTLDKDEEKGTDREQEMDGQACPLVGGLKLRYIPHKEGARDGQTGLSSSKRPQAEIHPPRRSKVGTNIPPITAIIEEDNGWGVPIKEKETRGERISWAAIPRRSAFFIKRRFPTVTMGKNRSKRNKIAAKARTNLEGKEKLSSDDLRHQITLSQSRRETQDKSCERSFHSKAPKSSHPKDSQAEIEKFDANSPIVRKLIGWLNKEGEARSQGTGRETGQGEDEEVESQGRIPVHKRMRKNASQRLGPRTEESGENSGGPSNEDARDILKLRKEMEELKRQVDKDGSFGPTVEIISPFTTRVMKAQLPRGLKAPEIRYKGVTDPNDHLAAYQTHMLMHAVEDEIQCRLFVGTLEGPAVKWFLTLPNGTIDCFKDLAQLFLNAYGGRFQPNKHFTHLFSLKQKEGETNSELVQRWNEAINEVEPMDDKTSIALFMNVLRSGELFRKLDYDTPTSYKAMMARVNKFCATEESDRLKGKSEGAWHKGPDKEKKGEKTKAATLSIPTLKSLAAPVAEIKSKEEGGQKRKRGDQKRRQWPYDPEKYCNFHRRPGHATEECHFLKKMEGEMKDKEPNANQEPNQGGNVWRRDAQPQQQVQENPEEFPQVGVIFGGPETGVTSKERKEWARKLYVGSIDVGQAAKKGRREPIVFSDEDLPLILSPHRIPLVISMAIHKFFVRRILVDTGSSVNVLYWEAAQQLGIRKEDLTKLNMPLSGFTGDIIEPVVDIKCAHNAILGRPGLEDLGGALSLEHLCLKFRTPEGVGRVLGDQPAAKKAYLSACKKIDKENLNIQTIGHVLEDKERKEEDRERPKPAVEMEEVVLFPEGDQEKVVRIGLGLEEDTREEIIRVLRENSVLFAWESKDMPGVDPSVICHKLNTKMDSLPVKQKKRYLSTDRKEFVRRERLTPYFQAHPVRIMTDQPLGAVLRDPSSSGRVIKWAMVLSQYDISYQPRSSKKGQVIADFMVECTARGKPEEDGTGQERKRELWEVHSDGSCTKDGSGGGAVLTSPEGFKAYHSFKFTFRATNNEAEYEALIGGIQIALFMKIFV